MSHKTRSSCVIMVRLKHLSFRFIFDHVDIGLISFYVLTLILIHHNFFADLVLQMLQQATPDSQEFKSLNEQLQTLQGEVVDLAQNYSRASVSKAE